jgi:hypothetical protein
MKLLPRLFSGLAAALLALPLVAFEGKVHLDMTSGRDSQQIVYSLKGEKARMEMPNLGAGMASIVDGPNQQVLVLMPEQRMYMVMQLQEAVDAANKAGKAHQVTFEDTGETEVILGRTCRKFRITERDSTSEIWAAEGLGKFAGQMGGAGKGNSLPAWQRELAERQFFPLRMITKDRKGKETLRMQATKIDEMKLDNALFEVPAGYQKFDLGGMMKGMIPGLKK